MKRSKDETEKQGLVVQIYPNQEQREYISRLFGSCRFIYNQCVAHNIEICRYNKNKAAIGFGVSLQNLFNMSSILILFSNNFKIIITMKKDFDSY